MSNENTVPKADEARQLVPVYFYGKRYDVPDSLTIMQAYEFAGHQYTRGCGCKGGACGACASIFRVPGDLELKVGLACQTQIVADMSIIQIPYFPYKQSFCVLEDLAPEPDAIAKAFPDLRNCMGCNTCTKSCPQDIRVMDCMSAAISGDIQNAAIQAISCVMCGTCAARCPAEIAPYTIMLACKRVYGRYIQKTYKNLPSRLSEIRSGRFDGRIDELMQMDLPQLKELYKQQQADKRII